MNANLQKPIKRFLKNIKNFHGKDCYAASITIALIVAFTLLIYSYIAFMKPNEFVSFSVLDERKEAKNYPELLVIGENNSCSLWIVVENHMGDSISCKVLIKITDMPIQSIPLRVECSESYTAVIGKGEKWEKLIKVSFNEIGDFHIIFELWIYDKKTDEFEFSNYFCVLNVKVIEA